MSSKLTLSIKGSIIERAKRYAKDSNVSLSQLIESYLERITSESPQYGDEELDNIVGIIHLPKDFDLKKELQKLRMEKYG